jgi:DNA polymerase V
MIAQVRDTRPVSFARPRKGKPMKLTFIESPVPAGFPSPADDLKDSIDLNAHLIRRPESTYLIRVQGDSMIDAGIFDGDLLVVDRSIEPTTGDIVIAIVNGGFTVKKLYRNGSKVELQPANPRCKKITFAEGTELEIWVSLPIPSGRFREGVWSKPLAKLQYRV